MATTDVEVEIEGRRLVLGNLDKVLYPNGFTKAQVIDYMARIAPYAIPHLTGRALTLPPLPGWHADVGVLREALPRSSSALGRRRPRPG